MAYFDSAKNRALWQEELNRLTAERERRRTGERAGREAGGDAMEKSNLLIQKITFSELLKEQEKVTGHKLHPAASLGTPEMKKTDALAPKHRKSL